MKRFLLYSIVMVLCLQSCRKDLEPVPPQVYTEPVSDISETSACFHGIAKGIGAIPEVKTKGFYISSNKDFSDAKEVGRSTGEGSYTGYINSLLPGETYYVRAYASNWIGTAYGKTIDFKTLSQLEEPRITTVANVTDTSVVLTGTWFSDNNNGFCYSYFGTPSISGSSIRVSDNAGTYSTTLIGLIPNTTYYVRAYTSNGSRINYSGVSQFTTLAATNTHTINTPQVIQGCIMFPFSVSEDRQVYFSQGNLQYQASTDIWRFAEHQYDFIGADNSNISESYTGWIDLFGYGTSGYNNIKPYCNSTNNDDYIYGNLIDEYAQYDWGIHNAISNGGNQIEMWRTPTFDEWYYLINNRTNAKEKYGIAQINGINGLILLPDEWSVPLDISFIANNDYYSDNSYTINQWNQMENAGAIFLPSAGIRVGCTYDDFAGEYWSSSLHIRHPGEAIIVNEQGIEQNQSSTLFFRSGALFPVFCTGQLLETGLSVRLVLDIEVN